MRLAIICLALGFAIGSARAQNETTNTRPLTLQETLELAVKHNLDVQIERINPQVALYTLEGDYGAYYPTLNVSGQHDHSETGSRLLAGGFSIAGSKSDDDSFSSSVTGLSPWGTTYTLQGNTIDTYGISSGKDFENSTAAASIRVTQPLLKNFLIDQTRLTIRVAKNRLKYSELGFKQRVMTIVANTEQQYFDLAFAREFVEVQRKAVELAERLVSENKKRVEVGALAPLDEQQAESQAASSQADLIAAQSNLAVQEHALKSLITDRYMDWASASLVPADPMQAPRQFFNRQDSWSRGLSLRPDLLQAKLDIQRAGIQLKYYKNQLLPELDVFGTYGYNGSGKEFSDALYDVSRTDRPFYTFGGQLSYPIGNVGARANYRGAKATEQQTVLQLKRIEQQIMVQIDDAIKQAESSFQRVAATRKAREYAEAALDAEQKKLESGKSTTYTVLQMQRDLTSARGNEVQALAAYNKNLSQLAFQEGTTLERRGLAVDVR